VKMFSVCSLQYSLRKSTILDSTNCIFESISAFLSRFTIRYRSREEPSNFSTLYKVYINVPSTTGKLSNFRVNLKGTCIINAGTWTRSSKAQNYQRVLMFPRLTVI
jgi:hypothetical protein